MFPLNTERPPPSYPYLWADSNALAVLPYDGFGDGVGITKLDSEA